MNPHLAKSSRSKATRCVFAVAAVVAGLAAGVLWVQEVWLRPQLFAPVANGWFAGCLVVSWVVAAVVWPYGGWVLRWLRLAVALVLALAAVVFGPRVRDEMAVRYLLTHEEKHLERIEAWHQRSRSSDRWERVRPLLDWLEDHNIPVPQRPDLFGPEIPYHIQNYPVEWLLQTCKWEIRKEFMRRMMADDARSDFLVREWRGVFPVVTGQDVTLANRLDMLDWLGDRDGHAATFWMALVVLTDPEAFADWRVPVRDRMLAVEHADLLGNAATWVRVLDLLVAMDAPDEWAALTQHLVNHPILMRIALRERIRGMEAHFPAMLDELDRLDAAGEYRAATALWVDLRHLARRHQNTIDHINIRARLAAVMADWLAGDDTEMTKRFTRRGYSQRISKEDLWIELSPAQRVRLRDRADGWLGDPNAQRWMRGRRDRVLPSLGCALLIRQFLDREDRIALAEDIAEHLMIQDWTAEPAPDVVVLDVAALSGFLGVWEDLPEKTRHRAAEWIRWNLMSFPGLLGKDSEFMRFLAAMPEIHPYLGMEDVDRLALMFSSGHRSHARHTRDHLWWFLQSSHVDGPEPFPAATLEAFLAMLDGVHAAGDDRLPIRLHGEETGIQIPNFRLSSTDYAHMPFLDTVMLRLLAKGMISTEDFSRHFDASSHDMWLDMFFDNRWSGQIHESMSELLNAWQEDAGRVDAALSRWDRMKWRRMEYLIHHLETGGRNEALLRRVVSQFRQWVEFDDLGVACCHVLLRLEVAMEDRQRDEIREVLRQQFGSGFRWFGSYQDLLGGTIHLRAGQVAWRDDALSAEHGWASQVSAELRVRHFPKAHAGAMWHATFAHLGGRALADRSSLDVIMPANARRTASPDAPLQATPWQRARELSIRRPDLHFPDHTEFTRRNP